MSFSNVSSSGYGHSSCNDNGNFNNNGNGKRSKNSQNWSPPPWHSPEGISTSRNVLPTPPSTVSVSPGPVLPPPTTSNTSVPVVNESADIPPPPPPNTKVFTKDGFFRLTIVNRNTKLNNGPQDRFDFLDEHVDELYERGLVDKDGYYIESSSSSEDEDDDSVLAPKAKDSLTTLRTKSMKRKKNFDEVQRELPGHVILEKDILCNFAYRADETNHVKINSPIIREALKPDEARCIFTDEAHRVTKLNQDRKKLTFGQPIDRSLPLEQRKPVVGILKRPKTPAAASPLPTPPPPPPAEQQHSNGKKSSSRKSSSRPGSEKKKK